MILTLPPYSQLRKPDTESVCQAVPLTLAEKRAVESARVLVPLRFSLRQENMMLIIKNRDRPGSQILFVGILDTFEWIKNQQPGLSLPTIRTIGSESCFFKLL